MRFHNYYQQLSGTDPQGPAEAALHHLLVEGAQELLARLNRSHFHAAPAPDVAARVAELKGGVGRLRRELHAVGLSGSAEAVPVLLELLGREDDENDRSAIINALARLGGGSIVKPLAGRYAAEDEDCRWYTLKAMDYVGSAEAMAVVREQGLTDQEFFCQAIAGKILGR
jgi:HEAT repeat protein